MADFDDYCSLPSFNIPAVSSASATVNPTPVKGIRVRLKCNTKEKYIRLVKQTHLELTSQITAKFPNTISMVPRNGKKLVMKGKSASATWVIHDDSDISKLQDNDLIHLVYEKESLPSKNIPCAYWYWWDDDNKWKPYKEKDNEQIEEAYQNGKDTVMLGTLYKISLTNRTQKRLSTHKSTRGTWFWVADGGSRVPYSEEVADVLEKTYQQVFRHHGDKTVKIDGERYAKVSKNSTRQYRYHGGNAAGREVIRGYNGQVIKTEEVWMAPGDGNDYFKILPYDVLVYMLSLLELGEIPSISLVCKRFAQACNDSVLWKKFCQRDLLVNSLLDGVLNWKENYELASSVQWDESILPAALKLSGNNRTVTHIGTSMGYAAVRSKYPFYKGVHNIVIKIGNKPRGEYGIGFIDSNFDCFKNQYLTDKNSCENYLYWTLGNFYEVTGMTIPFSGTYHKFTTGDEISFVLDMDLRTLVVNYGTERIKQREFTNIKATNLYLVANLYSPGDSITITQWNNLHYNGREAEKKGFKFHPPVSSPVSGNSSAPSSFTFSATPDTTTAKDTSPKRSPKKKSPKKGFFNRFF